MALQAKMTFIDLKLILYYGHLSSPHFKEWPMNSGKTIFSQLVDFLPKYEFSKCVNLYKGNFKVRKFSCWDQYLCMAFAQFTYRESLRDIEFCLRAMSNKLYHIGIRGKVSRSTLAEANENRDWKIYADFAQVLIQQARALYKDSIFGAELEETVYALDSTTISLCMSLFPWAKYNNSKAAIKLHTLLDLHGNIPTFIKFTDQLTHDVNILDDILLEPGAFYVFDRGYFHCKRLFRIHSSSAYFVTRNKSKVNLRRLYSTPVDKSTGLRSDQTVVFATFNSRKDYPEKLRKVRYFDEEQNKNLTFLTNNFNLPAITIAQLYKCRWQIELFFKWIKQHLRIKKFYGTSENAVKTQIWIAISVYVLVAIVKKKKNIKLSLYNILQVLSLTLFERKPINTTFENIYYQNQESDDYKQLMLFDL